MTIRKLFITPLIAITAITVTAADHVPVFAKNTNGSRYYRIPAVTTTVDGTLVAVADKRIDRINDLPGRIDIVARRSHDNGDTWGDQITVVANDSTGGYGDAAIVCDRRSGDLLVICSHGNGLWQDTPAHITVVRSADSGLTWSAPLDINPMIDATIPGGMARYAGWFASSGAALQTADGRLLFALVARRPDAEGFDVYTIISDDGGHTWRAGRTPATADGDESKLVQLADGTLLMSIRNRKGGLRRFARSADGGDTWTPVTEAQTLPDPACNGDILALPDGRILHSLPGHPAARTDVSIYVSGDNGNTWRHARRVVDGHSSYSAMTSIPDGSVGILIEEEHPDGDGFIITFTTIDPGTL